MRSFTTATKSSFKKLTISHVTASADDGNKPMNTIDNNFETRWSCYGRGSWIKIDLGHEEKPL